MLFSVNDFKVTNAAGLMEWTRCGLVKWYGYKRELVGIQLPCTMADQLLDIGMYLFVEFGQKYIHMLVVTLYVLAILGEDYQAYYRRNVRRTSIAVDFNYS